MSHSHLLPKPSAILGLVGKSWRCYHSLLVILRNLVAYRHISFATPLIQKPFGTPVSVTIYNKWQARIQCGRVLWHTHLDVRKRPFKSSSLTFLFLRLSAAARNELISIMEISCKGNQHDATTSNTVFHEFTIFEVENNCDEWHNQWSWRQHNLSRNPNAFWGLKGSFKR